MEEECANCGHDESDHNWDEERGKTICTGDGFFDPVDSMTPADPQCDCDMFDVDEEPEEDE